MDQKLRELERKAATDPQAALQLAAALKRLIQDQWQAVPCNSWESPNVKGLRHERCQDCHGMEFLRINVAALNEYVAPKDRTPVPTMQQQSMMMSGSTSAIFIDTTTAPGYGALPSDLANHYDDQ